MYPATPPSGLGLASAGGGFAGEPASDMVTGNGTDQMESPIELRMASGGRKGFSTGSCLKQ